MWISFRVHLLSLSLSLFFWSVFFPFTLMESFWRRVSCPTDRHAHRHMCFSVLSFGEEKHDSRLHLNVVIMWIYKAFSHDSCHEFSEPLNTSILCLFDLDMKSASGIITEVQFYVYIYIYIYSLTIPATKSQFINSGWDVTCQPNWFPFNSTVAISKTI